MRVQDKNYSQVKKIALSLGADLFGVASIDEIKNEFEISPKLREKIDKAVCLGVRLSQGLLEEVEASPTRLYFHHYRALNNFLDQLALRLSHDMQKKGFLAIPIPASQIVDWQKQTAHLSHKKIGSLAGLGWIGRNNLLVNKNLGSQFRLVTILTNMPLKIDKPSKDSCGSCYLCLKFCPAGAIKEESVNFDHIKCFEKLKEFQKQRLVDQFICGVCVNICRPKTKK